MCAWENGKAQPTTKRSVENKTKWKKKRRNNNKSSQYSPVMHIVSLYARARAFFATRNACKIAVYFEGAWSQNACCCCCCCFKHMGRERERMSKDRRMEKNMHTILRTSSGVQCKQIREHRYLWLLLVFYVVIGDALWAATASFLVVPDSSRSPPLARVCSLFSLFRRRRIPFFLKSFRWPQ